MGVSIGMTDLLVVEIEEETSIEVTFSAVVIDTEIRVCDLDNVRDDPSVAGILAEVGIAVNITDDSQVALGKVEAVVTVYKIFDESVVETAEGVCGSISVIDAIVFEYKVGASSAVTLTDDSLVVEDDIGDSVAVTKTD